MNKVILIGRLVRDPEMRVKDDGTYSFAKFTLAVNKPFKKEGEKDADFIRCVAFGKKAELCAKYLTKGKRIAIIGQIVTGSYTNKDGQTVYTTDIAVNELEFLESMTKTENAPAEQESYPKVSGSEEWLAVPENIEDELPF